MVEGWRKEIDDVDQMLVPLLEKRFELSRKIGGYKKHHVVPVFDENREASVLQRVSKGVQNKELVDVLQLVYKNMMSVSRQLQAEVAAAMEMTRKSVDLKNNLRVAYQGTKGAYGEEALMTYFAQVCDADEFKTEALQDFECVVEGVVNGTYDYGVLPIENTTTGGILPVYDLLQQHPITIVGEVLIPIEHQLLALPGAKLEALQMIYSHPQALRQSRSFLRKGGWSLQPYANTALSAEKVAELGDETKAAVGSKRAAEVFGLEILAANIHDEAGNKTRFIVVAAEASKDGEPPESIEIGRVKATSISKGKTSIVLTVPHVSGSLYEVIACLKNHHVNMLKIESRPLKNRPFEYSFHMDVEGYQHTPPVKQALQDLHKIAQTLRVLGSYADHSTVLQRTQACEGDHSNCCLNTV